MTYSKAVGGTNYSENPIKKEVGDVKKVAIDWNFGQGGHTDFSKLGDILRALVDDLTNINTSLSGLKSVSQSGSAEGGVVDVSGLANVTLYTLVQGRKS